jgi:hypothetical protein
VVVVALLALTACDPTGRTTGYGEGDSSDTDPQLVGTWRNQHLVPSTGDYTRVITIWSFTAEAACSRETRTLLFSEGIERTNLRHCTWNADGRTLSLTYAGYTDVVTYPYGFPSQHPDTLDIGGFLFAHVP